MAASLKSARDGDGTSDRKTSTRKGNDLFNIRLVKRCLVTNLVFPCGELRAYAGRQKHIAHKYGHSPIEELAVPEALFVIDPRVSVRPLFDVVVSDSDVFVTLVDTSAFVGRPLSPLDALALPVALALGPSELDVVAAVLPSLSSSSRFVPRWPTMTKSLLAR
ncbi:MAG: hypothetical protein AAFY31_15915, partial [Pseudomonadota bacterium]